MRIVVIIPTYNEAKNIESLIEAMHREVISAPSVHSWNVLVVDGHSTDATAQIVEECARMYPWLTLLREPHKKGLAVAYLNGIRHAVHSMHADAFVEFDGDGQHEPATLLTMAQALEEGADYVIGSRYIEGGSVPKQWTLYRKFLSRFGSLYTRLLLELPVYDTTSGFKMTRVKGFGDQLPLSEEELLTHHYAYKIQFLHRMVELHARIKEIPIAFRHREHDTSKSTWRDIVESLKVTSVLRLRTLPRWRLFRL